MDAKAFISEFGHIASAPIGVDQLRYLVMALALRGDLLKPNENLPLEIDRLVLDGATAYFRARGRRAIPHHFAKPIISEFSIPDSWRWKRVGELCDLQTGATPSTMHPEYYGGDIRWLVSGDVNRGTITDCEGRISDLGLKNSNCKVLPSGTVVIALNGQGKTRASVALLKVPAACNQSLVGMIPLDAELLMSEYLLLALRFRYREIRDVTGQEQRRGLNMGLVSELSVPLPPIAEQRQIVAKVDELVARCDKLEDLQKQLEELRTRTLDRNLSAVNEAPVTDHAELSKAWRRVDAHMGILCRRPADVEVLRASVLRLASRGALSFAKEGESSETFLASMSRARKRDLRKVGGREAHATTMVVDHPHDVPPHWVWTRLDGVADISSGSTPLKSRDDFYAGGTVPWVTSTHTALRYVDSVPDFVTDVAVKECRLTLYPVGTLLMAMYGQGKTRGQVTELRVPATTNQACAAIVLRHESEVFRKFVRIVLDDRYHELRALADGGAQPNLNGQKVKATAVPIPPLEEQARIVNAVEKLCSVLDALERMLVQKEQLSQALAINCVAAITGIRAEEYTPMKTPKTELISSLCLSTLPPAAHDAAPLAALLARTPSGTAAKSLWSASGLDIDAFYRQLKVEMAQGWIVQPEVATVREVATR